jgi:hypothetical protein
MPELDRVDLFRRLQARPPECASDTKVGHRLRYAGRPDRFESILPYLLRTYSSIRLHEHDEAHRRAT